MNQEPSTIPRIKRLSFDSAAVLVLTASFVLAGLLVTPGTALPFVYTKVSIVAIGALIALVLFIIARLTKGNLVVPPVTLLGAFWLVPLAYILSLLFSRTTFVGGFFGNQLDADSVGFVILLALIASLVALLFRRTTQYRVFFIGASIFAGVTVIAQAVLLALAHLMPTHISATSNVIGSFIDLGMMTGLGITIALLALRFLKHSRRITLLIWVGIVLGLFSLALINSLTLWIALALAALGLFIEAVLHRTPRTQVDDAELDGVETLKADVPIELSAIAHNRSIVAPLVVLAISLFFIIGVATIGNAIGNTFGTSNVDVRPSWKSTFAVGSHTYASSPIFGSGPNTFGSQWLRYRDATLNSTVFWNLIFTSGVGYIPTSFITTGLVGALAWIAFLAAFLWIGIRALLFRAAAEPYIRFVSVASYVGAAYVLGLAIFAAPGPMILLAGFALLGLFISTLRYAGARQEWGVIFTRNPRTGFVIVFGLTLLLLASVVAAYVVIERYLADVAYSEASAGLTAGNLTVASTNVTRSLNYVQSDRAYQLAALIGIAEMNKIANDTTLSPSDAQQQFQTALSASVSAGNAATKLNPSNYLNWMVLGQVYQTVVPLKITGAYDQAKAAYQQAMTLDPTDPTIPYTIAQLDIAQKDYADAEKDLTSAIGLKSNYTQAIFLLSQLEAQEGKAKDALQAAEAAAYFAPNDPTVLFQVGILRSANGDTAGAITALSQAVQADPQYANARFFLGVMYAQQKDFASAIPQLQAVGALSAQNQQAVASYITALQAGKNPFPANKLGALGVPQPSVTDQSATTTASPAVGG